MHFRVSESRVRNVFFVLASLSACNGQSSSKPDRPLENVASEKSVENAALASLLSSPFGMRYRLVREAGWSLKSGGYTNPMTTPSLEHTSLEFTTVGESIVSAGVMFLENPVFDATRKAFVSDLVRWFDPSSNAATIRRISAQITHSVFQIDEAPAISTTHLIIKAAMVGPEMVVSVRRK